MAICKIIILVVSFSQIQLLAAQDDTSVRVEVTSPMNLIKVDGILTIQCQMWNTQNGDTVMIARTFEGGSEQISSGSSIMESSAKNRAYLAIRTFTDGSSVYFLTMLDVLSSDSGEYVCTVFRMLQARLTEVGYGSIDVEVYSFPDNTQPSCSSNPSNLLIEEGHMLELICSSYNTFPVVDLKWRLLSTYDYIKSTTLTADEVRFQAFMSS